MTVEDQLSWALSRVLELEEMLTEANDRISQLVAGESIEWEGVYSL